MKYIINERQYKLLTGEEQEILHIPSLDVFGDWETLQKFLDRRGNPLYSVGGDLDLRNTNIESLGNLTSVGGYLVLGGTKIKSLENLTSVGGDLGLYGCKNLTSLGNLTSVGRNLYLEDCESLTSLGNLTSVGWGLGLSYSDIESLGNLTSVGGDLDLTLTPISRKYSEEEIRDMVKVDGKIYM